MLASLEKQIANQEKKLVQVSYQDVLWVFSLVERIIQVLFTLIHIKVLLDLQRFLLEFSMCLNLRDTVYTNETVRAVRKKLYSTVLFTSCLSNHLGVSDLKYCFEFRWKKDMLNCNKPVLKRRRC
jgi:hypothetical protein